MSRSRKPKKPKIQQMAYSGVHAKELSAVKRELKKLGATDIVVKDDIREPGEEYTKEECGKLDPKGPWYVVEYKK